MPEAQSRPLFRRRMRSGGGEDEDVGVRRGVRGFGARGRRGPDGAGQGPDRGGQRPGAAPEDDRQVLPEVHREARELPRQLRAEVHRHVHGPLHGRLEHRLAGLQLPAPEGEGLHVRKGH